MCKGGKAKEDRIRGGQHHGRLEREGSVEGRMTGLIGDDWSGMSTPHKMETNSDEVITIMI